MASNDLDTLLDEFAEAWRAGDRPRVADYVERAPPEAQDELAGLIAAFLQVAPTPEYTAEQMNELRADPTVQGVANLIDSRSGLWPSLLPRLRNRAKMTRDQVVKALAAALGVHGREMKVKRYYHEMETGRLDPRGVSLRVLESLADIFKVNVSELESAGDFSLEPGVAPAGAYFRVEAAAEMMAGEAVDFAPGKAMAAPLDEVDELFIGGR